MLWERCFLPASEFDPNSRLNDRGWVVVLTSFLLGVIFSGLVFKTFFS